MLHFSPSSAGAGAGRQACLPRQLCAGCLRTLQIDCRGLALLAAVDVQADLLSLAPRPEGGALARRNMHNHILRAIIRLDEAVTLGGVEPFHSTGGHLFFSRIRTSRASMAARESRGFLQPDLGDVLKGLSRESVTAKPGQNVVARAI